jgi:hypothetical protein
MKVGKIGRTSLVIAIVLYVVFSIPMWVFCAIAAFPGSSGKSPICLIVEDIGQYLILLCGFFTVVFLANLFCDDSSAREREMQRQILIESPRALVPDDEEIRV